MEELIKKLTKKTIIIIAVFLILLTSVIPPKAIYAAIDVVTAGETTSQFAINFYTDYKDDVVYDAGDNYAVNRQKMYNGEKCSDGKFHCDCVGWINFVMHQSITLDTGGDEGAGSCFIVPRRIERGSESQNEFIHDNFEIIYGGYDTGKKSVQEIIANAQPGDVILADLHVMLYVGNGEVVHCANGLQKEQLSENTVYRDYLYGIARLTEAAASTINPNNCTTIFGIVTGAGELDDYGMYWGTTTGRYTGSYTLGDWLFSKIAQFLDYLIGIMTYVVKIPFLGYTNIVEKMINDFLQSLTGNEMRAVTHEEDIADKEERGISTSVNNGTKVIFNDDEKLYKPTAKIETWDRVTIEDVIFNHIPILDVNVFSFDRAAGQKMNEESVIYQIRTSIAEWYLTIRNVSTVVMLLILVYLGIRLAITSSSEKKANYKGMLISWLSGLLIIYVIHYYMIVVIDLNQEFVKIFETVSFGEDVDINSASDDDDDEEQARGATQSLYDTIRTRAYSFKFTEGIPGTIIYMVLVYYMIKYIYIYFKRYLTVNILIVMAPVIGAKYAYDRVHRGKGGSVTTWMFDFFVNVFLQTIHAMIYTVFVSIVLNLAATSLSGFVLALFTLNFMQKAEKLFINIFKFEGRGSSLSDTRTDDLRSNMKTITDFAMFGIHAPKALWGGTKFIGKSIVENTENVINTVGSTAHGISNVVKVIKSDDTTEYKEFKFKNQLDKVKKFGTKQVEKIGDGINNNRFFKGRNLRLSMHKYKESDPKLYKAMKGTFDDAKKLRKMYRKKMFKTGATAVTGVARIVAGIPMFIVDGEAGALSLITGVRAMRGLMEKEKKYGYRTEKEHKAARTITGIGTFGMSSIALNEIDKFEKFKIQNRKTLDKLDSLRDMALKEDEIEALMQEINELEDSLAKQIEQEERDEETRKKKLEKEEKERKRRLQDTVNNAKAEVVSGNTIRNVIDDYMYEHNLKTLSEADIKNIMKKITELEGQGNVEVEFDSEFETNVKRIAKEKMDSHVVSKDKLNKKEAIDAIEDAIVAEGSVKPHSNKSENEKIVAEYVYGNNLDKVTDSDIKSVVEKIAQAQGVDADAVRADKKLMAEINRRMKSTVKRKVEDSKKSKEVKKIEEELKGRYDSLKQSVKEMNGIAEKAKVHTGSSAVDVSSYIKRTNTRQIAEKMKKGKKGGK